MTFLNPLPALFWLILLIPIIIFIINNRTNRTIQFSSIYLLKNLKSNQINKIKFLNILLLIIRILFLLFILFIIMQPHKKDALLNSETVGNKVINLILIDDSFSNLYGSINGIDQIILINDIVEGISDSYPIDSRIKIISLNKGLIFDGFNDDIFIENILDYDYSPIDFKKIGFSDYQDFHKNIHIISQFNEYSNERVNNFYNNIQKSNYSFKLFFHALPELTNNQYIKEVRLIDNQNQKFSNYEIIIGNNSNEDIDVALLGSKNLYNYNSKLYIDNRLPIYRNIISLPSNSIVIDTITIDLDLKESFELFFELNVYEENQSKELIDDRLEDNYYSYSLNIPKNINISVLYNEIETKNNISSILNSFKINTNNIDSNFYKVDYLLTQGLQKYSNIPDDKNILLFLGYNIFEKTSDGIILDFLKRENSQVLVFPTKLDIDQKKYHLQMKDSSFLKTNYKEKPFNSYDTVTFDENFTFDYNIRLNNNFKISNYFYHSKNKNSLLNINNQESIWSRYNIENGFIDLFGIFINYGNNFFDKEIANSIPLMYKIIIDEKINSKNSNLVINEPFKTANENNNKLKFINLKNDSIIFFNSSNKIFFSKDLMALIVDNKIRSLYSFNPDPKNFNTPKNKLIFPYILIDYNDDNNFKTLFSNKLNNSDLSNIFIYCLFLFLIIEMFLSNAKPPKSD
ncbi:MAG: hypothetical protein CMG21_00700 [Candidatus Marinimicrobia bacterium]|nr:hypothetical protein [Candidatus Neomarinimicrobiota bacterium]